MQPTTIGTRFLLILLASIWILLPTGCGKKGPPKTPRQILAPPVSDLKARVVNGSMTLYWTVPPESGNVTATLEGYYVFRASLAASENMCDECPRRYSIVAEPLIFSASQKEDGRRVMTYLEQLRKGYRYTYKVQGFTQSGSTGADSNIIEFVYGAVTEQEKEEE